MTRLTFGVSASSFAANMAVKRNAVELENEYRKQLEPSLSHSMWTMELSEQKQSKKLESSRANCKNCSTREDLNCGNGRPVITAS